MATLVPAAPTTLISLTPAATFVVLSTLAWVFYGLIIQNPFLVASNAPGSLAAIGALVVMLPMMKGHPSLRSVQGLLLVGCLINFCLWTYFVFSGMSSEDFGALLGIYAAGFCIILFASPLSTITPTP